MHITIVSSLDALCRQQAVEALAADRAHAVVVLHDLQENGVVVRQLFREGVPGEREETPLEHGCLSCTVRLDIAPTVEHLLSCGYGHIILGLPPTMAASMAVYGLTAGVDRPYVIDSAVLACDPAVAEDQIWDRHTLFESGYTAARKDERSAGEFLLGELAFSDTVLLADPLSFLVADDGTGSTVGADLRGRGSDLLRETAPHATLAPARRGARLGTYDGVEAAARTALGSVRIPAAESAGVFTTVAHRVRRPLHPGRFRAALPRLAEGCHWLRGRLWIASAPTCRIALQGIGPRVWLENTGPWVADRPAAGPGGSSTDAALDWHSVYGDRGSVVAVTGEDVDADEVRTLLDGCALSESEMDSGSDSLDDPFELSTSL